MAKQKVEFAYPPSPERIPEGLTDFSEQYRRKQVMLLISLMIFMLFYFGMLTLSGMLCVLFLVLIPSIHIFAVVGLFFSGVTFIFLLKGLLKGGDQVDEALHLPLTAEDHPKLFAFIRKLCREAGIEEPNAVFVSPDVNAAVVPRASLVNIFTAPKRDLLIGCGLVNMLNLSEFKAVLAHEFGHFAQGGWVNGYLYVFYRVVFNIVEGRDWFDAIVDWLKGAGGIFSVIGLILYTGSTSFRGILKLLLRIVAFQHNDVWREREFHADLVAASLAGSNAMVHCLFKLKFANESYAMAHNELFKAADHKLYTSDLYYHQHASGDLIRKKKKDPNYGRPPRYADPMVGRKVQIFDPDKVEDPADDGDYHPSDYDREENVKRRFVPAEEDERSAWILFTSPIEIRQKLTWKMYRAGLKIPKSAKMEDPKKVQQFIDDEHQETTYDDKYEGAYDDRLIVPGDLDELDELIRREPWDDARLLAVHEKLYQGLKQRVEDRRDIQEELEKVQNESGGATSRRLRKKIKRLEDDLEDANDWFKTLDRRVYLVYVQMSYRVDNDLYYDLVNRYRFHMAIQGIFKTARYNHGKAIFFANAAFSAATDEGLPPEFFAEVMHVLRDARRAIKNLLRDAAEINMPAMKNFEEGERLADFLLDQELIREPRENRIEGKWIDKLLKQLDQVRYKAQRLHFKSIGGILALQEKVAVMFQEKKGVVSPSSPN
jgi:Zn-dependent protease with chaperone function